MGFSGEDLGYLLGRNGSFGQFGMTSSFFGYFSGGFFCRVSVGDYSWANYRAD